MDNYAVKEPHRCSGCGSWLLGEQSCSACPLMSVPTGTVRKNHTHPKEK